MGSIVFLVRLGIFGSFLYFLFRFAFVTHAGADALPAATLGTLVAFDVFMIFRRLRRLRNEPVVQLVLLQREARRPTLIRLQDASERAWGVRPVSEDENHEQPDSDDDPTPFGPRWAVIAAAEDKSSWLINYGTNIVSITWHSQPMMNANEDGPVDGRQLSAVYGHQGGLLLFVSGMGKSDREVLMRIGCRLLAELIDDNTLAVGSEQHKAFAEIGEHTADRLRSQKPEAVFEEVANLVPVLGVTPEDPEMAEAVRAAREALPKFRTAWATRAKGDKFSIKCPITQGEITEHIWVNVSRMDDAVVSGEIGNEPFQLVGIREGDVVEVPMSDVEDWMVVNEKARKFDGGYSVRLLANRMTKKGEG